MMERSGEPGRGAEREGDGGSGKEPGRTGRNATPLAVVIRSEVTHLGGDIGTAATAGNQLSRITSLPLKFPGAKVAQEKKALPALLALLKSDEHVTAHEATLGCVHNLAMHDASSAKEATPACVRLIEKKLSEGQCSASACRVLSALASASTAATSAISGTTALGRLYLTSRHM